MFSAGIKRSRCGRTQRGHGHATAQPLAQRHDVEQHTGCLMSPQRARAADAGLHFVHCPQQALFLSLIHI